MNKWLATALAITGIAIAIAIYVVRPGVMDTPHPPDPVVEDFRGVERQCIATFNAALRQQRDNAIDEIELAERVERDVLAPWRAMAARVAAALVATERHELYQAMRRYITDRQQAWEAYVLLLRSGGSGERYHEKNAEADHDAQVLGGLLRRY